MAMCIRNPRTWQDALKDPRVEDSSDERNTGDGLWLYLKRPWWCSDTDLAVVHEWTVKDTLDSLSRCQENEDWWSRRG